MIESNIVAEVVGQIPGNITLAGNPIGTAIAPLAPGTSVTFTGLVVDTNNKPIAGATVNIVDTVASATLATTTTAADGTFSVADVFSTAGTFQIAAETGN